MASTVLPSIPRERGLDRRLHQSLSSAARRSASTRIGASLRITRASAMRWRARRELDPPLATLAS